MGKMSELMIEDNEADERGNFDPQDVAWWNFYCSAKECLPATVFNRFCGETFKSFKKAIDTLVEEEHD